MYILKRVILVVLVLFSAIALVEITLNVFSLAGGSIVDKFHYPYTFVPHSIDIHNDEGFGVRKANKYGFMDREYDLADTNLSRCLVLGNSNTMAEEVKTEQVYDNILEDDLSADGHKVQLWNAGWTGATLVEDIIRYDYLANLIPSKYILIQLRPSNISDPDMSRFKFSVKDDSIISTLGAVNTPGKIDKANLILKKHSAFWENFMLRGLIFQKYAREGDLKIDPGKNDELQVSTSDLTISAEAQKNLALYLKILQKKASEHHAQVFLFTWPITDTHAQSVLSQLCNNAGIHFIDISQEVKIAEKDQLHPLKGFINTAMGAGHINAYGHQFLAEVLYQKLKNQIR